MDKLDLTKKETLVKDISCDILEIFVSIDDPALAMSILHNVIGNYLKALCDGPEQLDVAFAAFTKSLNGQVRAAAKMLNSDNDNTGDLVNRNPTRFIRFDNKEED